ncbi:hypothetical protein Tco_1481836, partial [Tanacetum coccineum]
QVVINDEVSLNGPAHETQIVDLMESGKEDQESHSHTSEKHMANATVISKLIGEAPATVLSEPIGDIPAIEEIASEQQDEVENVVSRDDAMVSSERIRDISAKHDADIDMAPNNKNGSNDISLHADSDQMGILAANDLTPHIEYADGSHAVEDPNGTRPNHVAPNVRSVELGIPAGNYNQEKAHDTNPSVQQVASLVFDHSMPAILMEDRIQDQEGQADHTLMVEIEDDNMQNVEAIQVDQIIPEESSLNPHNEPSSVMSANPIITKNQAAMLHRPKFNEMLISTKWLHKCLVIQKINIKCEKEIAEAIAEIRLKYHNKHQEANANFNS